LNPSTIRAINTDRTVFVKPERIGSIPIFLTGYCYVHALRPSPNPSFEDETSCDSNESMRNRCPVKKNILQIICPAMSSVRYQSQ